MPLLLPVHPLYDRVRACSRREQPLPLFVYKTACGERDVFCACVFRGAARPWCHRFSTHRCSRGKAPSRLFRSCRHGEIVLFHQDGWLTAVGSWSRSGNRLSIFVPFSCWMSNRGFCIGGGGREQRPWCTSIVIEYRADAQIELELGDLSSPRRLHCVAHAAVVWACYPSLTAVNL